MWAGGCCDEENWVIWSEKSLSNPIVLSLWIEKQQLRDAILNGETVGGEEVLLMQ